MTFLVTITSLLQTCLRHPDSRSAKGNREGVFKKMREAMATITSVVQDDFKEDVPEKGCLAMDLGQFEVSLYNICMARCNWPDWLMVNRLGFKLCQGSPSCVLGHSTSSFNKFCLPEPFIT